MRPNHAPHGNRQQRRSQRQPDPEPPRHVAKFGILFLDRHCPRFQSHSANWATSRFSAEDLRMHRTGIFSLLCGQSRRFRFQCHPALRTRPRSNLPHFRTHRANILSSFFSGRRCRRNCDGMELSGLRRAQRHQRRLHRFWRRGKNFFRVRAKFFQTSRAAEVVGPVLIFVNVFRGGRHHFHTAHRVNCWGCRRHRWVLLIHSLRSV
jgi:hypothetical protein